MPASLSYPRSRLSTVLWRHLAVCLGFGLILVAVVASLYLRDRNREWSLRVEQAKYRLKSTEEMISRELDLAQTDALFLADQALARRFISGERKLRPLLETEYKNFVGRKKAYDQIRLLDAAGHEILRVNYSAGVPRAVPPTEFQDKSDRYYVRRSIGLGRGEIFISEFDLNLEYGQVERPLKPVIRVVTPVEGPHGTHRGLLVLNYLGADLLAKLNDTSVPGVTLLLRSDGHYLHARQPVDAWGWLVGHNKTFATDFPDEWNRVEASAIDVWSTQNGVFASRKLSLGRVDGKSTQPTSDEKAIRDSVVIVSYLPADEVYAGSAKLLRTLVLLAICTIVPLALLAWHWAQASVGRLLHLHQIAESEEHMRQLSARLLRIQEEERRAISREIHDELGQQVTAINLDLQLAKKRTDSAEGRTHLQRAIEENCQLLESLHTFARRVRPAVLDDLGLYDAIESHLWEFESRTGIRIEMSLDFESLEIPNTVAENVFRLLQEALHNVLKHASARNVAVDAQVVVGEQRRLFKLDICDDGRGYDTSGADGSRLGILGMRERVDLLEGTIRFQSKEGQGTRIEIRVPLGDSHLETAQQSASSTMAGN